MGGAAVGVGAGITINAASATIKGEKIDGKELLTDAAIGGLCGGVGGGNYN